MLNRPFSRPMHWDVSLRHALFAATVFIGASFAAPAQRALAAPTETWVVAGKSYERVRVLEVTAATVMIAHAGGMVQLDLATLPSDLQQRFNYDPTQAADWMRGAEAALADTGTLRRREETAKLRRGELEAARQRLAQRAAEAQPDHVEIRTEVDLRPVFTNYSLYLKNQGARPSCSIFAVVSVLEYEYARRFGLNEPLSEEYLIWAFQRTHPGTPIDSGYNFAHVIDALRESGIARRSLLPDSFATYRKDENPPMAALDDAATRRAFRVVGFNPGDKLLTARLVHALNTATPVILGVKWPPQTALQHNNLLKEQSPQTNAAHAVTLVGYRSQGTPESVVFIFRNSYGPQWGLGGYGLMAASYLEKNIVTAFCLIVPKPEDAP